jgi:hypothetical protein
MAAFDWSRRRRLRHECPQMAASTNSRPYLTADLRLDRPVRKSEGWQGSGTRGVEQVAARGLEGRVGNRRDLPRIRRRIMAGDLRPKGTPDEVVATIVAHSQRIVEGQEFRATLTDYGLVPIGGTSAAFQHFLVEDALDWAQVVKASNITVD